MKVRIQAAETARGRILRRARLLSGALGLIAAAGAIALATVPAASAAPARANLPATNYQAIAGAGSTWAQNAISNWISDVAQNGLQVNYAGVGSTSGRNDFRNGTVNFAASEIPYGVHDGNNFDPAPSRGYAYMPDVAGGTTFMYNLKIGPNRVTNLRLSGKTIADIFTDEIHFWDDPEVKADNPALTLPHIQIVPVVRSDGSGATADFTQWMLATNPSDWTSYCVKLTGAEALKISGLLGSAKVTPPHLPTILPGDSVRVSETVPGLYPAGPYRATVTVNSAWPPSNPVLTNVALPTATGSASLFAVPWALLVLIILLAGAGYGTYRFLRWRVRQRAAEMAAVAAAARKDAERAAGKAAASASASSAAKSTATTTTTTGDAPAGSQGEAE